MLVEGMSCGPEGVLTFRVLENAIRRESRDSAATMGDVIVFQGPASAVRAPFWDDQTRTSPSLEGDPDAIARVAPGVMAADGSNPEVP